MHVCEHIGTQASVDVELAVCALIVITGRKTFISCAWANCTHGLALSVYHSLSATSSLWARLSLSLSRSLLSPVYSLSQTSHISCQTLGTGRKLLVQWMKKWKQLTGKENKFCVYLYCVCVCVCLCLCLLTLGRKQWTLQTG